MKKIIALLLVLVTCFTVLVSCKREKPPVENTPVTYEKVRYDVPAGGYDGSEVTISFSHTMGEELRNILDQYIVEFNKIYPNITVEHSQVGGYNDVRDTVNKQLTAGNQPNIAYCYPDHVALYNLTGKVVPLDNFIESTIPDTLGGGVLGFTQEQIDNFIDAYYAEGTVFDLAGTMYTLPMSKSTEVLYYNKTFFTENNLTVPTTWAELEQVCAKIKTIISDPNSKYYNPLSYPLGYDSEANWFITMCEQYGSEYTKNDAQKFYFNNETNRGFVKMFRGWYEKGYFTTQELYGAYTSQLFTNTSDSTKGSAYMCIGSTGGAKNQVPKVDNNVPAFEVGIAPLPQLNQNNKKAISQGPSLVIFDQENKQEVVASWLFVKFLTTNAKFQAAFSMVSGYIPVIEKDVLVKALPAYGTWLETGLAPGAQQVAPKDKVISETIKVALTQVNTYYTSPAFNGSSVARDQVAEIMKYCFVTPTDNVDALIAEAFKKALEECIANS